MENKIVTKKNEFKRNIVKNAFKNIYSSVYSYCYFNYVTHKHKETVELRKGFSTPLKNKKNKNLSCVTVTHVYQ